MKTFNPVRKISILYFVTFIVVLSLAFAVCAGNADAKPPQTRASAQKTQKAEPSSPFGSFFGTFHSSKETSVGKTATQSNSGGNSQTKTVVITKDPKASKPAASKPAWKPFDKLFNGFGKKEENGNPQKVKASGGKGTASGGKIVSAPSEKDSKEQNISRDKLPKDIPADAVILSDTEIPEEAIIKDGDSQVNKETKNEAATETASSEKKEKTNLVLDQDDSILSSINNEVTTSANPEAKDGSEKPQETGLGNWNETIPDLDYIETCKTEPVLNVSPQRLAPHSDDSNAESGSPNRNSFRSLSAAPGSSRAKIGSRIGRQVAIVKKEDQAELKVYTYIPENLLTGVKNQLEIEVVNPSKAISEKSTVEIRIPLWMQVLKMESEKGTIKIAPGENSDDQNCTWYIGDLEPGVHEKMILQVVPQRKNAANIEVSWSNLQISSNQTIVSEEPEIRTEIIGPNCVLEGGETKVSIQVTNTGNCAIKDLNLICSAEGCQSQKYFVPGIPILNAGEKKEVQLNIRPASREKVKLHVDAMIQNRIFSQSDLEITVNFTDIQIRCENPGTCFVGMRQKIPVEVFNSGNVPIVGCRLCVELPPQLEFAGETRNSVEKDPTSGLMTLNVLPLQAGETQNFFLDLKIKEEGDPVIPLGILANSRTISEAKIPLHIEGVANVQMELNLPSGALTISEPGTYEIRLVNTGSQKIDDGKLLVFFSEGFEPQATFNGGKILEGGIVMFNVPPLVPGESQTFQIQAQVNDRGNYPIRCQLQSEQYHLDLLQQGTAIFR